jgi:hypothetical protein
MNLCLIQRFRYTRRPLLVQYSSPVRPDARKRSLLFVLGYALKALRTSPGGYLGKGDIIRIEDDYQRS